jgi:zinc transport system substrate-binding protein
MPARSKAADLVFWTGHGMELFLADALETLAGQATVVELADCPRHRPAAGPRGRRLRGHTLMKAKARTTIMPMRAKITPITPMREEGGDMHFWLDPENAALMVTQIATDPGRKPIPTTPPPTTANAADRNRPAWMRSRHRAGNATLAPVKPTSPSLSSTMPTSISKPASA